MEFILDNPQTEATFQDILKQIKRMKNGVAADAMSDKGLTYKMNWGVSIIQLRQLSKQYEKDHLLALKLWNKGWRETHILATMLEDPKQIEERQMDYWIKSIETTELIDQAIFNLYAYTKFAFVKAMEYCCGKKFLVNYAGLQLITRLARIDDKAINEMFEVFFSKLFALAKDARLHQVFYNMMLALSSRNEEMKAACIAFLHELELEEEPQAQHIAQLLLEDITIAD
ncbi:MAG: DNA alkylation repair protein [Mangrovibacterium sp.]